MNVEVAIVNVFVEGSARGKPAGVAQNITKISVELFM